MLQPTDNDNDDDDDDDDGVVPKCFTKLNSCSLKLVLLRVTGVCTSTYHCVSNVLSVTSELFFFI